MWSDVRSVIRRAISRYEFKGELALTTDLKAAKVILQAIYNHAASQLHSGQFHTYRGILSIRGASLSNIAEVALHEMRENSGIDEEQYREALTDLLDGIKECG